MSIIPDLLRVALATQMPANPRRTAESMRTLLWHTIGLFAAGVLAVFGCTCLLTALVLWMVPEPITPLTVLLVMGGVLTGVAALAWAVATGLGETTELVTDLIKPAPRPVDYVYGKINGIFQAFRNGLEGDSPRH